jgi:hydroxymethylbilane synthase
METSRPTNIVIGTRGSELARTQAQLVSEALRARWSQLVIETKAISTSGDEWKIDRVTSRAGRKGLFTAEIERALLAEHVDLAVHSAKDLPSEQSAGTDIAAVLPRAPTDDVLVAIEPWKLESLPGSAIVATGSVRRKHQLRWKRPDLDIVNVRGNVPTRLRKLATDQWHAMVLARAGLERLGHNPASGRVYFEGNELFTEILSQDTFLPAGGQGVIAVQIRNKDERARLLVEPLNDFDTRLCLRAEREFLRLLQADCNQPVGVLATINATAMKLRTQIFALGATTPREAVVEGPSEDAERLAATLWREIDGGGVEHEDEHEHERE